MDYVRSPAQFLHSLQYAAGKENCPFCIVLEENAVIRAGKLLTFEIIVIINKVDLEPCGRYAGHLYDDRAVYVANNDIHSG